MGYLKEKYIKEYYIRTGHCTKETRVRAAGIDEFYNGSIREVDRDILSRIDFKNKHVLDIGCGRGEAIKYVHEQGAARVWGVDFSEDAIAIANEFLKRHGIKAELRCEDALPFARDYLVRLQKGQGDLFDIVIMFDSVEHIPRSELTELLITLKGLISYRGIFAIHTPHFGTNNDVIKEGFKLLAFDGTEDDAVTRGMHCNRYTRASLKKYLRKLDLFALSHHLFVVNFPPCPSCFMATRWARKKIFKMGYPILLPQAHQPEQYEGYSWKRYALMRPVRWIYMFYKYGRHLRDANRKMGFR